MSPEEQAEYIEVLKERKRLVAKKQQRQSRVRKLTDQEIQEKRRQF